MRQISEAAKITGVVGKILKLIETTKKDMARRHIF